MGCKWLVQDGSVTASASVCLLPLCGPMDQLSNLGFDPSYSSRRPFVSPLNTILFTEGFSPESSRSPSVTGVLLLLLQVRMPCSLACLCSCISAIQSFSLETAPSLRQTISLISFIFSRPQVLSLSQLLPITCVLSPAQADSFCHVRTLSTFLLLHGAFPVPDSVLHGRDYLLHCRNLIIWEKTELASWHRAAKKTHFLFFGLKNTCLFPGILISGP